MVMGQEQNVKHLSSVCFCQLVKLCIGMIDAGKAYNMANRQFVNGIRELAQQSSKDVVIEVRQHCAPASTVDPS